MDSSFSDVVGICGPAGPDLIVPVADSLLFSGEPPFSLLVIPSAVPALNHFERDLEMRPELVSAFHNNERTGDVDAARIPDARTGRCILVPDEGLVKDSGWLEENNVLLGDVYNVQKFIPGLDKNTAFHYDETPSLENLAKMTSVVIKAAAFVNMLLTREIDSPERHPVVLHCKMGRSRSPLVLLAFFMIFRGMPPSEAKSFITKIFRRDRPEIAKKSAEFPNLNKFGTITTIIADRLRAGTLNENDTQDIKDVVDNFPKIFEESVRTDFTNRSKRT
jgi:hypothetical protein